MAPLLSVYRDGLLHDTLPFWIPRAIDRECGGYITSLDQDGTILHTDKPVWFQGRFAWLLATLYNTVERRPEWLELARHGIDFLNRHCFDTDGRMFFSVTREGRPLRKRRYLFSETFAIIALAAYGLAAGDERAPTAGAGPVPTDPQVPHARPACCRPRSIPHTRPMKGLAMPMILIVTAQELRKAVDDPICTETIDRSIAEIERDFLKPEFRCVLETVGPRASSSTPSTGGWSVPGTPSRPAGSSSKRPGCAAAIRAWSAWARRSSTGRWSSAGTGSTAASCTTATPGAAAAPSTGTT